MITSTMKKIVIVMLIIVVGGLIVLGVVLDTLPDEENLSDTITEKPKNIPEETGDFREDKFSERPNDNFEIVESGSPYPKSPELSDPPEKIRAIYLTAASAGRDQKIGYLLDLAENTPINAVVIDVNNFGGSLAYDSKLGFVDEYNIEGVNIPNIRSLVSKLHDNDIYVIARLVMFQDSALAKARPDLAIKSSSSTDKIWEDSSGQHWLDPASREVWARKMSIASEVSRLGFDEVNFDYIRFPSDGDLENTIYPFWNSRENQKSEVLRKLFKFMRESLPNKKISIDVFGLTTVNRGGIGIGQIMEDVLTYFDVVSPMVYPSHYNDGSFGISKPAEKPYEIVLVSLTNSLIRLKELRSSNKSLHDVKIRPWLQDFDLGAEYGPDEVKAQIQATKDSFREEYSGYMLWNPRNIYTREGIIE